VVVIVGLLIFGGVILPFFDIYCLCTLGFVHLKPRQYLEVLISCSLSLELLSMLWLDSVIGSLRYYISTLDWGNDSVAKHLPMCLGNWA
jgi:hypothetical protein